MSKDLRSFLKSVREAGSSYYVEVKRPLDPELELNIIQSKLASQQRYPLIYCPSIKGSDIPLVSNAFGSVEMFCLAFDIDPRRSSKMELLHAYMKRMGERIPPVTISAEEAPVKEVILKGEAADLSLLPLLKHAEFNSGKYMTMNGFVCVDPQTGIPNVGVYRHELRGPHELAAEINPNNHGALIAEKYRELGKPMEFVLFCGHHPAAIFGACQPGPIDMNEFEVMGGLLGEPIRLTKGETVDVPVPADAEIVIEGVIDPKDRITDGPFSEFLGYYGGKLPSYRMQVKCMTMRKDAISLDLDAATREHPLSMMLPSSAGVYKAVQGVISDVRAVYCPPSGSCAHHAYVSIKKKNQGEGKRAALAALASSQYLKMAVIVDEDVDVFSEEEVMWAISTRVRADRDITIITGVTGNRMDPGGAYDESYERSETGSGSMASKVIIDATKPFGVPFPARFLPNKELWDSMALEDYIG